MNKVIFKKQNTSLTVAIIVTVVTAILFSFLFLYLGINHRKEVYRDSKVLATEISRKAAFETQIYVLSAILTARSLEEKAQLLYNLNGSRDEIRKMVRSALKENKNFLGAWTLWEPNAFDGKDHLYKNDSMYNESGAIGMGLFRQNDSIFYEVMTARDYKEAYYDLPKRLNKEIITEPYYFAYTGYTQGFFGTSISVPIIIDNKFVGAIGIDIDLGNLQHELNKIKPYETGYLSLISNKGRIITHQDTAFVAKNIFDILAKDDTASIDAITNGKEKTFEIVSEFTGKKVFRMFYPIIITKGGSPWSMMIEVPLEKATIRSKQLLIIAVITLFIGLSLLIYLIINISERKRYENQLLMAKLKAEESDRLKSAFLNNISHEIRTPLNGILGFTELISDERTSEKEAESYKKIIKDSAKQLLSIISNVIELSRIQIGKGKLVVREFEIEKALNDIIESYRSSAEVKQLELKKGFPELNHKPLITTDEDKFKQIISYLLNNAIKFTHSGFIEIGYLQENDSFSFFAKDTGIGIKPEQLKNIFEQFRQGDDSYARKYGGLGVGLSITKALIDMLKGTITIESEENKGTLIRFKLPNLKSFS